MFNYSTLLFSLSLGIGIGDNGIKSVSVAKILHW